MFWPLTQVGVQLAVPPACASQGTRSLLAEPLPVRQASPVSLHQVVVPVQGQHLVLVLDEFSWFLLSHSLSYLGPYGLHP